MEASGSIPVGVSSPELVELVARPGPFVTVYLTTEASTENAAQRSEQHWKTLRAELVDQGASSAMLEAIDPLVPDAHLRGDGLAVIADRSGVVYVEHLADPPRGDVGRMAPLPSLGPVIEWHQLSVPYVVALVDRTGADLVAIRREGPDIAEEVAGADHPIRKVAGGGWSQRRFQQRAENTWDENARAVAAEVERLVATVRAQLVIVAGDERASQLLREHIDDDVDRLITVVDGGRAEDGSGDSIDAQIAPLVATVAASETRQVLEKFKEELGQADRAVEGVGATIEALNQSRVGLLLVPGGIDDVAGDAWFGETPTPVARSRQLLTDLGVDAAESAPIVDVLIRAALGTGAAVRVVPRTVPHPVEGVGAILRW